MNPGDVKTARDARAIVEARGLTHVKVGAFDADGIMRGKYMSRDKFFSALDNGFGFCDVVLGWDSHDQLYDNVKYTGWHTAYPDAPVRILPATCRDMPGEGDMLSPIFLGLQCADADDELSARIGRASQGYYTTKHEGALLVLPREGLIVFGYFG